MAKYLCGFLAVLLAAWPAHADTTVNLLSGQSVTGQMVKSTDTYVMLNVGGQPETFYWAEIDFLSEDKPKSPVDSESSDAMPAPPSAPSAEDVPASMPSSIYTADGGQKVISLSDGIIVAGHDKVVKYDKDLNPVKVVSLNSE
jgi:hypothetical protein